MVGLDTCVAWLLVLPAVLMALVAVLPRWQGLAMPALWRAFGLCSVAALLVLLLALLLALLCVAGNVQALLSPTAGLGLPGGAWLLPTPFGLAMALVVQLLGWVVGAFSARYLEGEPGQRGYVAALAGVLAAVHVLLLANHWLVLIAAWAWVGQALKPLLCFYAHRPFAVLAAHKKQLADRLADVFLLVAAALAWHTVGSGSLTLLWAHVAQHGASTALQWSAMCLVLAVMLRTALLPVHGWLIQVMEAPTPVSALLHAGVVNLGGFVLVRFAPLLQEAVLANTVLLMFGLSTALLAGLVMLTRISIKVRLAWSTVAQMGFMVMECGLGLYSLAALHLLGHSLYKAYAFLSASGVVRQTRWQHMRGVAVPSTPSLWLAPVLAMALVFAVQYVAQGLWSASPWPWWWGGILALAWTPLLWVPKLSLGAQAGQKFTMGLYVWLLRLSYGVLVVLVLTVALVLMHGIPLGVVDAPQHSLGVLALLGMTVLFGCVAVLHQNPLALQTWRRWSYAGFYVDELYTRLALKLWPTQWAQSAQATVPSQS